jgi:hypothetical protein
VAVDVQVLKALVGRDPTVVCDFLNDFRIGQIQTGIDIRLACAAAQFDTVAGLAHQLKSSARSVGAMALGDLCERIEKAGHVGDVRGLDTLLLKFEPEMARVDSFIASYIHGK